MIDAAVDALAAYRLTRLATADTISRPARARIIRWAYKRRDGTWIEEHPTTGADTVAFSELSPSYWEQQVADDDDPPKLAELITCRWCAGLWISGFVVVARRYCPVLWDPVARALALSATAALLAGLEE